MRSKFITILFIGILLLLLLIPAINISCGKTLSLCPPYQFFSGQSYCLGDKVDALEKDASIVFSTSTGLYHKDQFDNKYFEQITFYYHGLRKTIKAIVFKYDPAKAEGNSDVDSIAIGLIDILETKFGDSYRILERPSREISDGVKTPELPILMWPIEGGGYITLEYPPSEIYSKFKI
jgi:hypothetical protein